MTLSLRLTKPQPYEAHLPPYPPTSPYNFCADSHTRGFGQFLEVPKMTARGKFKNRLFNPPKFLTYISLMSSRYMQMPPQNKYHHRPGFMSPYQRDRSCGMPWADMLQPPFRGIWGQERRWRCNLVSIEPNEAGETWEGLQQVKDLKSDPFFPWRSTYLLISQYWGYFPPNSPLNREKVKISQHHPADVCCGGTHLCDRQGKSFTKPVNLPLAVVFLTSD